MKEKKQPNEYFDPWDGCAQPTYRTGGTQPPKSHGSVIAFLLVLVIFLCGVSTTLGLMNIRLFRQLSAQETAEKRSPVVFSQGAKAATSEVSAPLGFVGQTVPAFWQNYHDLPQGVYVTEVLSGSDACRQGILPGDILTAFNGTPVTDTESLQALLETQSAGSCATVSFYRDGEILELTITLK